MTVFNLPPDAKDSVVFTYSPVFEAASSLRVLCRPKRHPLHHPWVLKMRRLSPNLKQQIRAFEFGHTPGFLIPTPASRARSWDEELRFMLTLDTMAVREEFKFHIRLFLGESPATILDEPPPDGDLIQRAATIDPRGYELIRLALEEPAELLIQFVTMLDDYWSAAFHEDWEEIEPKLAAEIIEVEDAVASLGLYRALQDLSRYFGADARLRKLTILAREVQIHSHEVTIGDGNVLGLVPSVYAWPQVLVACDPPWPLAVVYPARFMDEESRGRVPPADLTAVLHALGDDTRMSVLRLVAERARTTQELARVVRVTEPTLSRHLRVLADSGLVVGKREGRYVWYRLVPDRLSALSTDLLSFLQGDKRAREDIPEADSSFS